MYATRIEQVFKNATISWWNPVCGSDNRFWIFQKQGQYLKEQLRRYVDEIPKSDALDAGCGRGVHSKILNEIGCRSVTSLDINPAMLEATSSTTSCNPVEGSLMNMPFQRNTFDIVVSIGTSMHVPSIATLVAEISRVLKPGGIAAISIANKLSLYVMWTTRTNPALVAQQRHYLRRQFSYFFMRKVLENSGFSILNVAGFGTIPPLSLRPNWQQNFISPQASYLLSRPLDRVLGKLFGCGITFMIQKQKV